MPHYRKLHTKITESQDVEAMPDDFARLLWTWLPLALDREGRGIDTACWVKSKLFPLKTDAAVLGPIEDAMVWYADRGMIRRYEVQHSRYFDVPRFHDHQGDTHKESDRVYPAFPEGPHDQKPEDDGAHQTQLETKSGPTPDQVERKSATDVDSDSDSDADSDAVLQKHAAAEQSTGLALTDEEARCWDALEKVKGFPKRDKARAELLREYITTFPNADAVPQCEAFAARLRADRPLKAGSNPMSQLRSWLQKGHDQGWGPQRKVPTPAPPEPVEMTEEQIKKREEADRLSDRYEKHLAREALQGARR